MMRVWMAVLLLSIGIAPILISSGYGWWQERLIIKGQITVVEPGQVEQTVIEQVYDGSEE